MECIRGLRVYVVLAVLARNGTRGILILRRIDGSTGEYTDYK